MPLSLGAVQLSLGGWGTKGSCLTAPPLNVPSTLPGKYLEDIAAQMRIHGINALLMIGGFEVRSAPLLAG